MSDVKVYKLISSEEVIATVIADDQETVTLEDPVTLAYQPIGEGKMSVGFAPFMPQTSGKVILQKAAIAVTASPKEALIAEYNRINSKIITPPKDIVV